VSLRAKNVAALLTLAGYLGLMLLALMYWERTVRVESTQGVMDAPVVENQKTPEVNFLGYSELLDEQHYEATAVGGLSGLAYDPDRDLYYGLADRGVGNTSARFYALRLPLDGSGPAEPITPTIVDVTTLRDPQGQPLTGANFDGEGIAVTLDGALLIASETDPSISRFSIDGRLLAHLPVPQKFLVEPEGMALRNGSFESLSRNPDGSSLFTANEVPLTSDGEKTSEGRRPIRILRYEDRGSSGFEPSQEFFYLTEPAAGVNDLEALSGSELLVLEGGRRVFRISLDEAQDASGEESLADPNLKPVKKELLVDVADCPLPRESQNLPGNFEGMSLGPELPDGRQALILQSDDNFDDKQKTRLIAFGIQLREDSSDPLLKRGKCEPADT
jgi:hypothetical protein